MPPVDGLDQVTVWTNREATTMKEIPGRVLLIGGGPVGVELGQLMARFGAKVTIVQGGDRIIEREDAGVCHLINEYLEAEGVDVRMGLHVASAERNGDSAVVELEDGSRIECDVVVAAAGRAPRISDIGLETVGLEPEKTGLPVDERCSFGENLWGVGDCTGEMAFTHVAMYQARVVSDNILGRERKANYTGVPRVVFTDPEVGATGLTEEAAKEQGLSVATARIDLAQTIARPVTYEEEPRGHLELVADRDRGVLVGAWAVAPMASEWIHVAAQAIRAEIPIETLRDGIAQFPTYNEGYLKALEALEL